MADAKSDREIFEAELKYTEQDAARAFEWLRLKALDANAGARYASIVLCEVHKLKERERYVQGDSRALLKKAADWCAAREKELRAQARKARDDQPKSRSLYRKACGVKECEVAIMKMVVADQLDALDAGALISNSPMKGA